MSETIPTVPEQQIEEIEPSRLQRIGDKVLDAVIFMGKAYSAPYLVQYPTTETVSAETVSADASHLTVIQGGNEQPVFVGKPPKQPVLEEVKDDEEDDDDEHNPKGLFNRLRR